MMDAAFPSIMCRVCEEESNLLDLSLSINQNYVNKFVAFANVTFDVTDKLPHYLCRFCTTRLCTAYEFKQKCEGTEKKLLNLLQNFNEQVIRDYKLEISSENNDYDNNLNDNEFNEALSNDDINNEMKPITVTDAINETTTTNEKQLNLKNSDPKIRPKCDICKKKCKSKSGIELHMKIKHNMATNLQQCPYCDEWFTSRKYPIHIDSHEKPYKCEQCWKNFSSGINLRRHKNDIHANLKPYQCNNCGSCFKQKSVLKTHISRVHLKESNFQCSKCDKSFTTKILLNNHEIKHLPIDEQNIIEANQQISNYKYKRSNEQMYICEYCGKITYNIPSHYAHNQTHNSGREYECDVCGKKFKTRMVLYSHKRTHTTVKPYQCDICDKKFLMKAHWKYHQKVHTGEKPYKCEYCGKGFALKGNYTTHKRIHTGEKPFKCEQCEDGFIDLNGLKRHRKKVHNV